MLELWKKIAKTDDILSWVKVFRIIPEFRIMRLTFHRKPQKTELGRLNYNIFTVLFLVYLNPTGHLNLKLLINCKAYCKFEFWKLRIFEILNFPSFFLFLYQDAHNMFWEVQKWGSKCQNGIILNYFPANPLYFDGFSHMNKCNEDGIVFNIF